MNPDPLDVTEDRFVVPPRSLASQTSGYRPVASPRLVGLLLAALSGAFVAGALMFFVGRASAAPRTAPASSGPWTLLEAPHGASPLPSPPAIGTRPAPTGDAPDLRTPPATSDIGTALEGGIASFVGPSYGSRYLALPEGPGVTVRICAESRCVTRTSTDAGPDKAMQRAGRVADLSWADFKRLCGCDPYVVGLLRVTVERGGPSVTPPATDTTP